MSEATRQYWVARTRPASASVASASHSSARLLDTSPRIVHVQPSVAQRTDRADRRRGAVRRIVGFTG
jgi:hypothetical protein